MQELTEKVTNGETAVTFMPSQRDTALSGRKARSVLRARNAPMLPMPIPSAPKLISDICNERTMFAAKYHTQPVAAISSEWWGSGGGAPSGVQGQSPWSGDQRGIAPMKLKELEF